MGESVHNGVYYHSKNLWETEIGDYRVEFSYAGGEGEEFTTVGKQSGQETGEELFILQTGLREAGEVFLTEHHQNRT